MIEAINGVAAAAAARHSASSSHRSAMRPRAERELERLTKAHDALAKLASSETYELPGVELEELTEQAAELRAGIDAAEALV